MGDSSPAADKLMRSQGVRALPSFHFVRAILARPDRTPLADAEAFEGRKAEAAPPAACLEPSPVWPPAASQLTLVRPRALACKCSGRTKSRSRASAGRRHRRCKMRSRRTCNILSRVSNNYGRRRRALSRARMHHTTTPGCDLYTGLGLTPLCAPDHEHCQNTGLRCAWI